VYEVSTGETGPFGLSIQRLTDVVGRALLAAVGYAIVIVIAGGFVRVMGLPLPEISARIDPSTALATNVVSGLILGLILGQLARRLPIPTTERFLVLFLLILIVNRLLNLVEGVFFTTLIGNGLVATVVIDTLGAAGIAALLAVLFPPIAETDRLAVATRRFFRARPATSWTWRIILAGLLYLPTYFVFGMLAYPFVRSYYEDPALGAGVRVPAVEVIVPLEIIRGLLYVVALIPFISILRQPRWRLALWLGLIIATLNAWEPLIANTFWPVTMRVTHGLEITADSLVQGFTIAWLLGLKAADVATSADSKRRHRGEVKAA